MAARREIVLPGLVGSSPLGALAAFGLLRACTEIPELSEPCLHWRMEDDWMAVLTVASSIDESALLNHLGVRQRALKLDIFSWSEDIRVEPEKYRVRLIQHGQTATARDRRSADYYAAFGSDTVTDGSQGLVKPTAFHMTSGQQKLLKIVAELAESLLKDPVQTFKEAMFGPWKYSGRRHSLGWDPVTERLYAYRHKDPSKKTTDDFPNSVPGAVWLAAEAIPLFPTTVRRRRLETTGFIKRNINTRLVWPIWKEAIALDTLKMLLATSELLDPAGWNSLGRRGVAAIYESARSEFGKGYAILHPASLAWNSE
jgi:hypothetical protein